MKELAGSVEEFPETRVLNVTEYRDRPEKHDCKEEKTYSGRIWSSEKGFMVDA